MINKTTQGYYFGRYEVAEEVYTGDDFSKRCFVFPGQGFAFPGMFRREYDAFETIRKTFARADALAKRSGLSPISDYIIAPEKISKEQLPIVRNLALFTLEVALSELLVEQKNTPTALTGHSYGEYAVLVAAGVLSFEDAFDVAYHRDRFAPRPNEAGTMIAIGADASGVRTALDGMEFYISNYNTHAQTVVSVRSGCVEDVKALLERQAVRCRVLADVPQPYHSPYLNGVRDKMRRYVDKKIIEIKRPHTPFISSVTHTVIDGRSFKKEDIYRIMAEQITEPVQFIGQIEQAYGLGCRTFVDVLGTNSFGGFVKNILAEKDVKCCAATDCIRSNRQRSARTIAAKDNKLFAAVSRMIGEITGYEIEKIALEDRYQEDLGIDSIKKADIILTVLNESKIDPGEDFNPAEFGSVGDTIAYLERAKKHGAGKKRIVKKGAPAFGRYVFAWEERQVNEWLLIDAAGERMDIALDEIYADAPAVAEAVAMFLNGNNKAIVVLHAKQQEVNYEKAMAFYICWNAVAKHIGSGDFMVLLVSTGAQNPLIDGYGAFLKSLKKELPNMFFKQVCIVDAMNDAQAEEIIKTEAREPFDVDIRYEGGVRLVSVRNRAPIMEIKETVNRQSVIIALGGAKGITYALLKHIAQHHNPILYAVGKSNEQDGVVGKHMAALRVYNPDTQYRSLDARDFSALDMLFTDVQKKHRKIDMVINGTGVVDVALLKDKKQERAEEELSAKLLPAMHIMRLRKKYRPKRIVNFSSVISKYGSAGQCVYTMANEIVAGLSAGCGDVCVVHWPAWEETGMTARGGVSKNLERLGVPLLKPEQANALFAHELSESGLASVYYMDKDDDMRFGFGLQRVNEWKSLIGTPVNSGSMAIGEPVFERIFDRKIEDSYLNDHCIGGIGYVPAAVMMSMFLCAGKIQRGVFPAIKDFAIHNPIKVNNEPVVCRLAIEDREQGVMCSIRSNIVHATGWMQEQKEFKQRIVAIPSAVEEIAPVDVLYVSRSEESAFYLGKSLQVIERIMIDKDGVVFTRIDTPALRPLLQCGPYDKTAQWIESALQTLGAAAARNGHVCIPTTIEKVSVRFTANDSRYYYGILSNIKSTEEGIKGTVALVNDQGEVVLLMRNCFMKKIANCPIRENNAR